MAKFVAADVKKLRELTGAGMMDCKKALEEAAGDVPKAVEILRIKGQKGVAKRESRTARNGAIVSLLDGSAAGVLLELNCETDFVAKGERFIEVANAVAAHVAKTSPADLAALLAEEIEPGKTVQAFVDEANAALGEKIVLNRFAQFAGDYVTVYLHHTSPDLPPQVGVLAAFDKENAQVAKEVAQHIAAFGGKYLSRDDVPAEVVVTPSSDPRSYRVNSDRLLATGFRPKKTVEDAVKELIGMYSQGKIKKEDSWYNLKWMEKEVVA